MMRSLLTPGVLLGLVLCILIAGCAESPSPEGPVDRRTAIPVNTLKVFPETDAYPPVLHSTEFDPPVPLPGGVNTAGAEDSPFITEDGKTLYFFFTPDPSIPADRQLLDRVTGIYESRFTEGTFGPAQRILLQDPGRLALDGCPFVREDTLWFCSAREGFSGVQLFTAKRFEGGWRNWQSAGDILRKYEVGEMHLSEEDSLYFHSARPGGMGGLDLWVTEWRDGKWQQPVNLVRLNTPENEGWPFVTRGGDALWFTRTFQGSPAIYRSLRTTEGWGEPEQILSSFAAEPTLDAKGNLYFAHHYVRNGTLLEADIYRAAKRS